MVRLLFVCLFYIFFFYLKLKHEKKSQNITLEIRLQTMKKVGFKASLKK